MTVSTFQGLVLRLGNQMFVRHYLWLSYPNATQLFGLQFTPGEPAVHLQRELIGLGFEFREGLGIWVISGPIEPPPAIKASA